MKCIRPVPEYPTLEDVFKEAIWYPRVQERVEDILLHGKEKITPEDAEKKVMDSFYNEYVDIKMEIDFLFRQEDPRLYRAIGIVDMDDFILEIKKYGKSYHRKELKGLGISWAISKEKALVYFHEGGTPFMIDASINPTDINIDETFLRGFIYGFVEEQEIVMNRDSEVTIKSICKEEKYTGAWIECIEYDLKAFT